MTVQEAQEIEDKRKKKRIKKIDLSKKVEDVRVPVEDNHLEADEYQWEEFETEEVINDSDNFMPISDEDKVIGLPWNQAQNSLHDEETDERDGQEENEKF